MYFKKLPLVSPTLPHPPTSTSSHLRPIPPLLTPSPQPHLPPLPTFPLPPSHHFSSSHPTTPSPSHPLPPPTPPPTTTTTTSLPSRPPRSTLTCCVHCWCWLLRNTMKCEELLLGKHHRVCMFNHVGGWGCSCSHHQKSGEEPMNGATVGSARL